MRRQAASSLAALLSATALFLALPAGALARDDEALGFERTPPRLAFTDGAVSFFRADSDGWTPASVNLALAAGDALATGDASNLELQIGPRAWLRAGEQSQLGLVALEPDFLQLRLDAGTLALDLRQLDPGQTFQLATPHGVFHIERPGYYRVGVRADVTTFSSRRGGSAEAVLGGGSLAIASGEQLVLRGGASERYAAPELDAWDRWNYARSEAQIVPASAQYVPDDVYGASDLDRYGAWRTVPEYGAVWVPQVAAGWAPYSNGYWISDPYYGYTWVDYAPWGWAPFHYGRWVYTAGVWGWCPGPRVTHAYYAPALVAFYGGGGYAIGASWVALGWGEPLYPWWGPSSFRNHYHWAGWHGPHDHDWNDDHDHHRGNDHGRGGEWHHDNRGHDQDRGHDWNDRPRDQRSYRNASVKNGVVKWDQRDFAHRGAPHDEHGGRDGRGDDANRGRPFARSGDPGRSFDSDRDRGHSSAQPGTQPGEIVRHNPRFERGEILRDRDARDGPGEAPRVARPERRDAQPPAARSSDDGARGWGLGRRTDHSGEHAQRGGDRAQRSNERMERGHREVHAPSQPALAAGPPAPAARPDPPRARDERRERPSNVGRGATTRGAGEQRARGSDRQIAREEAPRLQPQARPQQQPQHSNQPSAVSRDHGSDRGRASAGQDDHRGGRGSWGSRDDDRGR